MNKQRETEKQRLYKMMVEAENAICAETPHITDSERLEKVADVLLAAGVVFPPCKVGDMVWVIVDKINTPIEAKVRIVHIQNSTIALNLNVRGYFPVIKTEDQLGESIFLEKEEAEAALARKRDEKV